MKHRPKKTHFRKNVDKSIDWGEIPAKLPNSSVFPESRYGRKHIRIDNQSLFVLLKRRCKKEEFNKVEQNKMASLKLEKHAKLPKDKKSEDYAVKLEEYNAFWRKHWMDTFEVERFERLGAMFDTGIIFLLLLIEECARSTE